MADTFKGSSSGCGSSFEAWVHRYVDGDPNKVELLEKRTGFRSRPEAQTWVRQRIREAEGRPVKAKKPDGCWNCRYREGGTRWEAGACVVPIAPFPALPWSITNAGFDPARLTRTGVWPTDGDGEGCPTWSERPKP